VSWSDVKIKVRVPATTPWGQVHVAVKTAGGKSAAKHFTRM